MSQRKTRNRCGKHRRLSSSTLRKLDAIEASAGRAKHVANLQHLARIYRKEGHREI